MVGAGHEDGVALWDVTDPATPTHIASPRKQRQLARLHRNHRRDRRS
jgi:hypothetical protein